jgi:transposase
MTMYAKVRRMRLRDGLTISEIARRTSLARNTVKGWLRGPVRSEMAYRRSAAPKKIGPYETTLRDALAADARRPRRERRTARKLYAQIRAAGFSGSYARVTEFVRAWRAEQGAVTARSAYVPLSFAWGEAFQFDWSEEGLVIGGVWRKVQLAHLKLCASRAFWLAAYPSQGHEMLFDAHTRCLTGVGGVASRGIYDNMKTAVDRTPRKDRGRVINARFAAMVAHYLFEPDFCNVASGWEKGRVEKGVQDARRQIWQDAAAERFDTFAALNAWLATRCRMAWDAPHPELSGLTIYDAWLQERPHLMPMPAPFDGYVEMSARVSSTSLVSVARSRYSVPCAWAGQRVSARRYPDRVVIVGDHDVIAEHPRAVDRDQVTYTWQHYLPLVERKPGALRNGAPFVDLPESLQRLRQALLRHAGGDKVMARVLMAVPTHGLDAVLVAVELVLASGRPSAEHVLNVLARLTADPAPPSVATTLTVTLAPLADPERYDALRDEEVTHG